MGCFDHALVHLKTFQLYIPPLQSKQRRGVSMRFGVQGDCGVTGNSCSLSWRELESRVGEGDKQSPGTLELDLLVILANCNQEIILVNESRV